MIKLLLLGIVLAALIWYFAYRAGVKTLEKDYEREYNDLVHAVNSFHVTPHNFAVIRSRFCAIRKYRCKDRERLSVLMRQFKNKFAEVIPAKTDAA